MKRKLTTLEKVDDDMAREYGATRQDLFDGEYGTVYSYVNERVEQMFLVFAKGSVARVYSYCGEVGKL